MKKLFQKYGGFLAALAIVVTTMNANATCLCIMHQDSLPDEAKRLRKFLCLLKRLIRSPKNYKKTIQFQVNSMRYVDLAFSRDLRFY